MTEQLFDVENLRQLAFRLSCEDQYRLATFIAENVGYVLGPETAPQISDQSYFQSHECAGYRARISISWSTPEDILLSVSRAQVAETIADSILAFGGPKMRDMVSAMRGLSLTSG